MLAAFFDAVRDYWLAGAVESEAISRVRHDADTCEPEDRSGNEDPDPIESAVSDADNGADDLPFIRCNGHHERTAKRK